MHDETAAVIELRNQIFTATVERADSPSRKRPPQLSGWRDEEITGLCGVDAADPPAHQKGGDSAPRYLDLGKLGHWNSSAERGEPPHHPLK
jgi:hypothetical protein